MWEFRWPWMGILIPCILIAAIAYGSHILVFRHHLPIATQVQYQVLVCAVWTLYVIAIFKSPGKPNLEGTAASVPNGKQHAPERKHGPIWHRWCNKCRKTKPERAHHCRKCGTCILAMDHHCPWINNCVGHGNTPHFFRFLSCTQTALLVTLYHLSRRLAVYYDQLHMPAYLLPKAELAAVVVLWPLAFFVLLAMFVLFLKCSLHLVSGKTQIEVWEYDRIVSQFHTERLWLRIRENYRAFHGRELGRLVSWNGVSQLATQFQDEDEDDTSPSAKEEAIVPPNFTPDDLVFPYDLGLFQNLTNALGPFYTWLLPWGTAKGNGMEFPKNDDDDQLDLPWPPDGGNVDFASRIYSDDELRQMKDISLIKKHLDPRSHMSRADWTNDMGEGLADYGVDLETEEKAD